MALELRFRLDRNGDMAPMRVTVLSDGPYGAAGLGGVGSGAGLPEGLIDGNGFLQALDGGPYMLPMARLELDPEPFTHRLIIRREGQITGNVAFIPKVPEDEGFLDINEQLRRGGVPAYGLGTADTLKGLIRQMKTLLDIGFKAAPDLSNMNRVAWRFDAGGDVILDGVNDTTVTLVHAETFRKHVLPMSRVTGLTAALNAKADLVDGKLNLNQLPDGTRNREFWPKTEEELLALDAYIGDVAHLDGQRYLLIESSPRTRAAWLSLDALGQVTSVNGQTGVVTLAAADVGAMPSGTRATDIGGAAASHTHTMSQITDKESWLSTYIKAGAGISVTSVEGSLEFAVAASGESVDWMDIAGKPTVYPADWKGVANKPTQFVPSPHTHYPSDITNLSAYVRGEVDLALYNKTLSRFNRASIDAVGAGIISDTLEVTAANGAIRLEVAGGGFNGLALEESDGQPSLTGIRKLIIDGGELVAVDAETAKLTVKGGGAGGTLEMSYTPKYKRSASVTNPIALRSTLRCRAVVHTAFAQADGRDIRVYTAAGDVRPSAIVGVLNGPNYADYTVVWSDTLNGLEAKSYEIRYGDPYAPERPLRQDELYMLLNRLERPMPDGSMLIRVDQASGYRSPDWEDPSTAGWIWGSSGEVQQLPAGGFVTWAGKKVTAVKHIYYDSSSWTPTFILLGEDGSPVAEFCTITYSGGISIFPPNDRGQYRAWRQLPDGCAWDFANASGSGRFDLTLRYRVDGRWTLTQHQYSGSYNAGYMMFGVRPPNGNWFSFNSITPWCYDAVPTDQSTWAVYDILMDDLVRASVGDEQVYTP